ncbi:MAG: tRNA (adenosine(37)-N6)-threonylcarbamoyltransferase complex ATPase subunit type 1 TsaE [Blastomonas sp.]
MIADEAAMAGLGRLLADEIRPGDIVALSGSLGAGKTTLARSILQALGHEDEVPSPTFAILQYYDPPPIRIPVIHADFYRLESGDELEELGLDLAGDQLLIAEWAENIGGLAGPATLELRIERQDASARRVVAHPGVQWVDRWNRIAERICKPN